MRLVAVVFTTSMIVLGGCTWGRGAQADRILEYYLAANLLGERTVSVMRRDSTLRHSSYQGVSGQVPSRHDGFTVYALEGSSPPGARTPGTLDRVRAVRLIADSASSASLAAERIRRMFQVPPSEGCAGLTTNFRVLSWSFGDRSGAAIMVPVTSDGRALTTQLIVVDQNVDFRSYLPRYRPEPCNS